MAMFLTGIAGLDELREAARHAYHKSVGALTVEIVAHALGVQVRCRLTDRGAGIDSQTAFPWIEVADHRTGLGAFLIRRIDKDIATLRNAARLTWGYCPE